MAYVDTALAKAGTRLGVDFRGTIVEGEVTALPFVKKS
jgi:glycine cleavage system aminomethyltransferase T